MTDEEKPKNRPHLVAIDGDTPANTPIPLRPANTAPGDDHVEADNDDAEGANDEALRIKLTELEQEHRDLDVAINSLEERMPYDRLTIQRLKKKKLALKDQITKLHAKILPDIIA